MRKVEVVPYEKKWSKLFQNESNNIKNILGDLIVSIHHVGSTAIPNMDAKPVIDILIEVTEINKVDSFNKKMNNLGYIALGENGILNRRFFSKGGNNRTHHIHIFETGNSEINRHLLFRDYLIAHPKDAKKYSLLKQRLAHEYPENIDMYIKGKDAFIKELDKKAKEWKENTL